MSKDALRWQALRRYLQQHWYSAITTTEPDRLGRYVWLDAVWHGADCELTVRTADTLAPLVEAAAVVDSPELEFVDLDAGARRLAVRVHEQVSRAPRRITVTRTYSWRDL